MKKEQKDIIIWAIVAFLIGMLVGIFLISPTTNGKAVHVFENKNNPDSINNIKAPILPPGPGPGIIQPGDPGYNKDEEDAVKNI